MDITVVIPIHKFSEEYKNMLSTALSSVKNASNGHKVSILVGAKKDDFDKYELNDKNITLVEISEDESTNFQHIVNKCASKVKTDYFSILEIDDWYTVNAFNNLEKYTNSEFKSQIMLFLSESVDFDKKDLGSNGYLNEAVWARGFSEELGYIDSEVIQDFFNFSLTGAFLSTKDFISVGGLKESIKISFWYEFMLRALKYGQKAFVIPKVGYVHVLGRPDSLSDEYSNSVGQTEAEWWIDLAKKEYFYKNDRNKTYEE